MTHHWGDAAQHYPDVIEMGGAPLAWQAEFDRQGITLTAQPRPTAVPPDRGATVAGGDRTVDLVLDPWSRRFSLSLRAGGPTRMHGFAPDLAMAAGAARLWLSGVRTVEVADAWPFLGSVALAEAR